MTALVDIRELTRFVITGVIATLGNIAAVKVAGFFMIFELALLVGLIVGLSISFLVSKLFAFRSHSWKPAGVEVTRFLIVYGLGSAIYWVLAVFVRYIMLKYGVIKEIAEISGILVGGGIMMLTSYFGHRFFTYRTHQNAFERLPEPRSRGDFG